MSWQHQQQRQQQFNYNRNNNGYRPQAKPPVQLKRQASELKSLYTVTKWCACYVNTESNSSASNSSFDDNLDVASPIPQTNIYVPMDLEENLIAEIEMYIDEDKEIKERLSKQKKEITESKQAAETDKNQKIETFMSFTSITDRNKARQLLESNGWDLQKAAAQQFSSSQDVSIHEGRHNKPPNGGDNNAQKAIIRMILPDNRQYTYQMDGNDTFWGVYGRLLQSVPELASKAFSLELQNGHVLNENEFDQTLAQAHLIPRGDIRIKY
eukprot:466967_1